MPSDSQLPDAPPGSAPCSGSASAWKNQVVALEIKTDRLRESAYKAGCFQLAADLQEVTRALYRIRANKIETPNDKLRHAAPDAHNSTDGQCGVA